MWDEDSDYQKAIRDNEAWVSDEDLAALTMERHTGARVNASSESELDQAKRMIREASPMAAASIIKLAQHSDNETVRLRASTEILNRAESWGAGTDGREPWMDLIETTSKDVEEYVKLH